MKEYIEQVETFYSKDPRKYHTIHHIKEMFSLYTYYRTKFLDEFISLNENNLYTAIIWHDAVYIPGCKWNEEFSAELFERENKLNNSVVSKYILSTKIGTKTFETPEEKVLHDLDWHAFAKCYSLFLESCNKIVFEATDERKFTDIEVKQNQLDFYKSIVNKKIFVTKTFSKFNEIAKRNLIQRISELELELPY